MLQTDKADSDLHQAQSLLLSPVKYVSACKVALKLKRRLIISNRGYIQPTYCFFGFSDFAYIYMGSTSAKTGTNVISVLTEKSDSQQCKGLEVYVPQQILKPEIFRRREDSPAQSPLVETDKAGSDLHYAQASC